MLIVGDSLDVLKTLETDSVDLVFCSPPYEAARTYGIGFQLRGQAWVDWALARFVECSRVSRGLVAWVVEGQTRKFQYTATPALLMADLHRAGVKLRKPPIFQRVGIPGSGGPDWLRNDYEFIVCASKGKLPWSDNTAMGHPPKWAPGGAMSNRQSDGARVNQWGHSIDSGGTKQIEGGGTRSMGKRPSHVIVNGRDQWGGTLNKSSGSGRKTCGDFKPLARDRLGTGQNLKGSDKVLPVLANPGNVIRVNVGGGLMGSKLAHENEAPFPEKLAEFFVKSFCPPGGTVLDPFCGSGTTLAAALKNGRVGWGIDIRESQIDLTQRRLAEILI